MATQQPRCVRRTDSRRCLCGRAGYQGTVGRPSGQVSEGGSEMDSRHTHQGAGGQVALGGTCTDDAGRCKDFVLFYSVPLAGGNDMCVCMVVQAGFDTEQVSNFER